MTDASIPPLTAEEIADLTMACRSGFVTPAKDVIRLLSALAEMGRERDEARSSLAAILKSRDAWQENCLAEKARKDTAEARIAELVDYWGKRADAAEARATSAEALSAAAVERERVLREALEAVSVAVVLPDYVAEVVDAALSSPAPIKRTYR